MENEVRIDLFLFLYYNEYERCLFVLIFLSLFVKCVQHLI